jgi:hypothetical protein
MFLAHAFGQRYELPLPLTFFIVGGATVVFLSFLLVFRRSVSQVARPEPIDEVPALPPLRAVPAAAGLVVFAGLIAAGVGGSQVLAENIVPTAFWVVLWIVVPLSCAIVGDWTKSVNPLATLARLADSTAARRVLFGDARPVTWPRWLGWWPAVVTFVVVVYGELIFNQTATLPRFIGYSFVVLGVLSVLAGCFFGAPVWVQRGEMFSVLFATWGRLGYWRFGAGGRQGPGGGLVAAFEEGPGRIAFVLMLLVSVSFDGLLSTPTWQHVRVTILSTDGGTALNLTEMAVLIGLGLATFVVFGGFAAGAARLAGRPVGLRRALVGLLPSLLPISFGYLLAHYLQYIVINGQLLIPLLGDPAGLGWKALPAPFNDSYEVRVNLLPIGFYWYTAAVVIVGVHVVAVLVAHNQLGRDALTLRSARRSEWPWLVAMVAYTMVSLWLLAQPLVKEKPAETASSAVAAARPVGLDSGHRHPAGRALPFGRGADAA